MVTKILPLEEGVRKDLHGTCMAYFLDGQCYAFAIALSRQTGWPIFGLMQGHIVRHAVVRRDINLYMDARGVMTEEEIGDPFDIAAFCELKEVTEEWLLRTHNVCEVSIARAKRYVEVLWPDVPLQDTLRARAVAFTNDLEALCRKHGLWLREIDAASPLVLGEEFGGEAGYSLGPMCDGLQFTIRRRLK